METIKIKELMNGKFGKIIIVMGSIGILLIMLSSFLGPNSDKTEPENNNSEVAVSVKEYSQQLEMQIVKIIKKMLPGSDVSVMITLNSGVEYVYATESRSDSSQAQDKSGDQLQKNELSDSVEESYIIITDENGNEKALKISERMPKIRGVVVVCTNGNSENIQEKVKKAVSTALDINSNKVFVTGRN
ncbi:MAG: hypothetical protein Q4B04_02805 [bacterium]|nr:hypothetical protein [bacterium]